MSKTYSYTVLRYRHSLLLQEEVNIGLLFFFQDDKKVEFLYPGKLERLSSLYPDFSAKQIRKYFKAFRRSAEKLTKSWNTGSEYLYSETPEVLTEKYFLTSNSYSLYFTEFKNGLYENLEEIKQYYFDRYLSVYEGGQYRNKNESYILHYFEKKIRDLSFNDLEIQKDIVIESDLIKQRFDYGWRNENLHLLAPVGFDLQKGDSIISKACQWQGRLNAISETINARGDKIDLFISRPENRELFADYDRGLKLIDQGIAEKEIVEEDRWESYINSMAKHLA